MHTLKTKEWVGIAAALAIIGYIFFSGSLMSFFKNQVTTDAQPVTTTAGFKAQDIVVGSGQTAEAGDTITAHYVGQLTNGQIFDSSVARGTPITFTLGVGQVIRGWDEGLIGMKEGGKRILTISPEYGYGDQQVGPLPPNSTLVFEVQLLKVVKK